MRRADLRWFAKKGARRAMAAVAGPLVARRRTKLVRVLTYHRFAHRPRDPFAVSPDCFERQIAALAASGRAIGLDRLMAFVGGDAGLPRHAVLVTIDDGAASTLEIAAPILRRHAVPAVAFVTAGRIGQPARDQPERFLDRDEIASLPAFGIDIGSHASEHCSLGRAGALELAHQLSGSKQTLEVLLDREVFAFAYPFGTRADFSWLSRRHAAAAGYRACFTSQHGPIAVGADALMLPRIKIEGGDPMSVFESACSGGLDPWLLVDRTLNRLQAASDQPIRA